MHTSFEPIINERDKMPFEVEPVYLKLAYYTAPAAPAATPSAAPAPAASVPADPAPAVTAPAAPATAAADRAAQPTAPTAVAPQQ
jgi:hypothetical protein